VLSLLDQLHATRRNLGDLLSAVAAQPAAVRTEIASSIARGNPPRA
jgi:hypothetical protein